MSLFNDYIVKVERRNRRLASGTLPPIEVSRHYEKQFYKTIALMVLSLLLMTYVLYGLSYGFVPAKVDVFSMMENASNPTYFPKIDFAFAEVLGIFLVVRYFLPKLREPVEQALRERDELSKKKAAKVAAEEARKAAEAAEKARRHALVVAEQHERQKAIFEFRVQALRQMEEGLKELLYERRERAEWIPESADEEHLYETIRRRFKLAGKDVPELGILRRSSDPLVIMILGDDRSYLPKDPPDEVLARRQLPPVVKLLT